jgi:hypothetical protein
LKRIFEGYFSPQISSKSLSPQRNGAMKKRERKSIEKRREKEKKRKTPIVSSNKKGKSIF